MRKRLFLFLGIAAIALPIGVAVSGDKANPKDNAPPAAPVPKTASSRIVQVTVYPNSALITREVDTPAGVGPFELVVNPLPPQTVDSSLYSEGSDSARVMSTRFRTRPVREDTREEVRKLEDELRKLSLDAQKLQADLRAAEQNSHMVTKLEDFTAITNKTNDKTPLNSESIIALSKYVMDSRAARAK